MDGRATLTIDASSTTTNCAQARSASASPFRSVLSGFMVPVYTELTFRLSSRTFREVSTLEDRPLRADARRNRAAIVRAARTVFAKYGREAQMDDVARRAKVGVGTLYRHFPTKDALLVALIEDRFARMAEAARESLEIADPWEALETFLRRGAEVHARDRALSQAVGDEPGRIAAAAMAAGMPILLEELVRRGQDASVVRPDARWEDIPMIFCSLGSVAGPPRASWERMLAVILDGLRAPGAAPLPD